MENKKKSAKKISKFWRKNTEKIKILRRLKETIAVKRIIISSRKRDLQTKSEIINFFLKNKSEKKVSCFLRKIRKNFSVEKRHRKLFGQNHSASLEKIPE
jgi:hypothetical protein